jgi:NAD-dependent dihydropyrimidine dehydrogenase PreA subunit
METIFTAEEAAIAVALPSTPASAGMLAEQLKMDEVKVGALVEAMAKKGILFSLAHEGTRYYVLLPLIPGIIENQLLTGEVSDRTRNVARFFDSYLSVLNKLESAGRRVFPSVPFARVITVDREIPEDKSVQPYDRILQYIDRAQHLGLVTCHCRHMYELLGDSCDKPRDVCMAIGPGAKYMADYGLARPISREQAREVLERAEKAGLVHMVSNTGKYLDFICNCCSCHCENLKSLKRSRGRGLAAISSFISAVNADECIGCGDCTVRCPMEALALRDEVAILDCGLCIGCGLCVSTCPTGAITLKLREGAPVPFADSRSLNAAIISSLAGHS